MIMRRMTIALTAAVLAVSGLATAGWTQISRSSDPFMINADDVEFDEQRGLISYIGRAEAMQSENRLRAGRFDVYYSRSGEQGSSAVTSMGGLNRIEAIGDVYFVTPEQVVRGDRAVYTAASDTLVVSGDVILRQGDNVMTGSNLSINIGTGRARMEGAPTGNAGRRVQGVFYPDRD
ncbi:lipopolysaccharide transport periplasmic protein lpta [Brevundimonas abyssalis TAR-001]|jgi:lipopolysaccharide export system protein LptA|uniref:Lipopolysaccharide transport periplasmic protein lpta n=3 Tax=Brevundimonas TaxID=41275 RepID=A0A8E0NCF0_9CAUL|nr:lipopolysaccharide transport periplasmic protein lpta [Brevundimonas abyssalis TAR-001]